MVLIPKANLVANLRWLILLPIPVLWCVLESHGFLTFLENKSIDWRFQHRGELDSPVKLIYVDVDSLSLDAIGNLPWSRDIHAKVAAALIKEAKVKVVGFDFVFSDAGIAQSVDRKKLRSGNEEFARFLFKEPPVVLAASYVGWQFIDTFDQKTRKERHLPIVGRDPRRTQDMEPPEIPTFERSLDPAKPAPFTPPGAFGLIDTIGNGTRMVPAWAPNNSKTPVYYHMSVHLARLYWGLPPESLRVEAGELRFVRSDGKIHAAVPLVDGQLLEINWFTHWASALTAHAEFAEVYEYADMLSSADPKERDAAKKFFANPDFKDAVVLIGPVDAMLQDTAPTSLDESPVPKVGVHGNLLKTIIGGTYLKRISVPMGYVILFGLTMVVARLAVAGGARALFSKILAGLAVVGYVVVVFWVFERAHVVVPLIAPLGATLTTSFVGLAWQVFDVQKAKARMKGMFGTYVSPQLVERMVESGETPQLGGHDAEITAYFSDIQGFSGFSEKLGSGPLVELMNEYLTACTDIVTSQGGTLDKYIGDAVVAMFGAPMPVSDHAFRACVATQLVHRQLGELREKWKKEGEKWPEIVGEMQSRIGLNTGLCMIGNMGSRTRFNYTMMGDNVNLAARMESGSKSWGVYTMVSAATKLACEKADRERVVFRPLGRIVVMGRTQAVPIYEIMGLKESLAPTARECMGLFEEGLLKYYARDWEGAIERFRLSERLEPNQPGVTPGVKTNPSLVYLGIVSDYQKVPPPADWAGVYVMKDK